MSPAETQTVSSFIRQILFSLAAQRLVAALSQELEQFLRGSKLKFRAGINFFHSALSDSWREPALVWFPKTTTSILSMVFSVPLVRLKFSEDRYCIMEGVSHYAGKRTSQNAVSCCSLGRFAAAYLIRGTSGGPWRCRGSRPSLSAVQGTPVPHKILA